MDLISNNQGAELVFDLAKVEENNMPDDVVELESGAVSIVENAAVLTVETNDEPETNEVKACSPVKVQKKMTWADRVRKGQSAEQSV